VIEGATQFVCCTTYVSSWHEYDLRAALTNVRSWESNGLNADVAFGPFMTLAVIRKHSLDLPR